MKVRTALIGGVALVALLAVAYFVVRDTGLLATSMNPEALHERVLQWGLWGPLATIGLMTLAILVSPIPSAPIALAAGAAYGHGWGVLYVLLGAQLGAMAAFALARIVGAATVHRWFGKQLSMGLIGSQNALMGIVFVTRLLPFLSFDIVSNFAGLTVLSFWRLSLATFVGTGASQLSAGPLRQGNGHRGRRPHPARRDCAGESAAGADQDQTVSGLAQAAQRLTNHPGHSSVGGHRLRSHCTRARAGRGRCARESRVEVPARSDAQCRTPRSLAG